MGEKEEIKRSVEKINIKEIKKVYFIVYKRMNELRNILASKDVSKNSKILDICCGDGSLAHKITSFGFTNVKGVDRNLNQLKQHLNKRVEFLQADVKDLFQHFEADSVEVILCCRSLHFIDNI